MLYCYLGLCPRLAVTRRVVMQAGGQIGKLAYIDDQTTTAQVRNGQQTTNGVPTNTMQWGVYGVYLGLFSKQILCDFW